MSLDGIMLAAIKEDLNKELINGRIDKIYQVNSLITLLIRNNNYNYKLLISADPNHSQIHITEKNFNNPIKAPDFCMLLRKYLLRGTIINIKQPDFERLINIEINLYDKKYMLITEVMGKYSNIILVNDDGIVLDAIKRVTTQISRERELYPGVKYKYPPKQDKLNPLLLTEDMFKEKTRDFSQASYKAVMYNFRGIGPYSAREIVFRAGINPEKNFNELREIEKKTIWNELNKLISTLKNNDFHGTIGLKNEKITYISAFPLNHIDDKQIFFNTTGELLDFYYQTEIITKELNNVKNHMNSSIENYLKKNLKKQKSFKKQLKVGKNAEQFKEIGELITSNIYRLKSGMKKTEVIDYYDPEQKKVSISLDPKLSPSENAQKYFKKYNKAKKSLKYIKIQLRRLRHEERYLEQLFLNIEQTEIKEELEEIKEEMINEGYIKEKKKRKNKNSTNKSLPPHKFSSSKGYDILVGRNNRQNDHLTKKIANKDDLWLHVKDLAGSHVILRNHTKDEIPSETIKEAAILAAYYSKGRNSENVAVDYTKVKNVQKAKGAKPGLVYYENYQTIYVTPKKEIIKTLS